MFWRNSRSILAPPQHFVEAVGGGDYFQVGNAIFDQVRRRCNPLPSARVLDVGSGCGRVAVPFTRYLAKEASYDGFDVVLPMIEWCRANISTKFPNFRFAHANLKNTYYSATGEEAKDYTFPYADCSFDLALATSVFTHLLPSSASRYAFEIARVLENGGRGFLSYFLRTEDYDASEAKSKFVHRYTDYDLHDDLNPEAAIALDERMVLSTLRAAGLSVDDITYGSWANHRGGGFQDVIVVSKD